MIRNIKKLLDESGLQPYYDAQEEHIAKFAELIVRECVSIADRNSYGTCSDGDATAEYIADQIRMHFNLDGANNEG